MGDTTILPPVRAAVQQASLVAFSDWALGLYLGIRISGFNLALVAGSKHSDRFALQRDCESFKLQFLSRL
jgi:hypothetical protein